MTGLERKSSIAAAKLFDDFVSRFHDVRVKEPSEPKGCCGRAPKEQKAPEAPSVPLSKLLGKLDRQTIFFMVLGSTFALLQGVALPAFSIAFGELFQVFLDDFGDTPAILQVCSSLCHCPIRGCVC